MSKSTFSSDGEVIIDLMELQNLFPRKGHDTCDPFVVFRLDSQTVKSSAGHGTNPKFTEKFRIHGPTTKKSLLIFEVYDKELSEQSLLGAGAIDLFMLYRNEPINITDKLNTRGSIVFTVTLLGFGRYNPKFMTVGHIDNLQILLSLKNKNNKTETTSTTLEPNIIGADVVLKLLEQVKAMDFDDDRLQKMIEFFGPNSVLSTGEMCLLLEALRFSSHKIRLCQYLLNHLIDLQNYRHLFSALDYKEDKEVIEQACFQLYEEYLIVIHQSKQQQQQTKASGSSKSMTSKK